MTNIPEGGKDNFKERKNVKDSRSSHTKETPTELNWNTETELTRLQLELKISMGGVGKCSFNMQFSASESFCSYPHLSQSVPATPRGLTFICVLPDSVNCTSVFVLPNHGDAIANWASNQIDNSKLIHRGLVTIGI